MPLTPVAALAAVLAVAQTGSSMMSHATPWQATKVMCRPSADSRQSSPAKCRGEGATRLEVQPVCFCDGIYFRFEEPACTPDGRPAIFPAGHHVTPVEDERLISCKDVRHPASIH